MVTASEVHDSIQAESMANWSKTEHGPAYFEFRASGWRLEIEARNPKSDQTWRITLKNLGVDEEMSIGPVQSRDVVAEVIALLDRNDL